ncbi:putative DDE Tnp4 domain-containing protein [Phytophthora infestans]|uniref:Putative DDE Tnp4 domain-containing protein n=1 Tax=Phytophthora infestans TaxID=4787 RepID=A0A833WH51_PHYIN|nr:putative DDE Tnp4 domain-containing protein [Phytophthora infestans]
MLYLILSLANAEVALHASLKVLPDASISVPSKEQQVEWANLTQAREPLIQGILGFVVGKNYRVQEPTNADLQNAHYNGT